MFSGPCLPGRGNPKLSVDRTIIELSVNRDEKIRTEIIKVSNNGRGELKGTLHSNVPWIKFSGNTIKTPLIQDISIIFDLKSVTYGTAEISILTNGGNEIIPVKISISGPKPILSLNSKSLIFCHLKIGEIIKTSIIVKNTGTGLLTGVISSKVPWIEIPQRSVRVTDSSVLVNNNFQIVNVLIKTSLIPPALHPVGNISVKTNGGEENVSVSLNFSSGPAPSMRLTPDHFVVLWKVAGLIEERMFISNDGSSSLRGTIPSVRGLTAVPSIFTVEPHKTVPVIIRVDTREFSKQRTSGSMSCQIPLQIITNVGIRILSVDIARAIIPAFAGPAKRTITPRTGRRVRQAKLPQRLSVYNGQNQVSLVSSGKSGGEGEIWFCSDKSICVKIFHPHRITPTLEEKIQVMTKEQPETDIGKKLTWPKAVITDKPKGRFIGYLMNRIPESYVPVHLFYDKPAEENEYNLRIRAAANLALLVAGVHDSGHCIGDLRENNVLVSKTGEILIIDTDSFQVKRNDGRIYPCTVGTGEFLPPEMLKSESVSGDRRYSDLFALAVLIFKFLMDGVHPYQAKGELVSGAPTTVDKILLGYFAYDIRKRGLLPPDYAPDYLRVQEPVRELFSAAFVSGHGDPKKRPTADRWYNVLSESIGMSIVQAKPEPDVKRAVTLYPQREDKVVETGPLPGNHDDKCRAVVIGEFLIGIPGGKVFLTGRPDLFAVLPDSDNNGKLLEIPDYKGILNACPPSWLLPRSNIRDNLTNELIGFTLPAFDVRRFRHWNLITNPETRKDTLHRNFSFRHRVAACRNLAASLMPMEQSGLITTVLDGRCVTVGPDTMVRIIISGFSRTDIGYSLSLRFSNLAFQMLTGYKPDDFRASRFMAALPSPVLDLFDEITLGGRPSIVRWFDTLDKVLHSLVRCKTGRDHWYIPEKGWCPFCYPYGPISRLLPVGKSNLALKPVEIPLISAESEVTVNRRNRRSARIIRRRRELFGGPSIRLPIFTGRIPLISSVSRPLQIPAIIPHKWPYPVLYSRCLAIVPVSMGKSMVLPFISLIDEMRWASAFDRLKGEYLIRIFKPKPGPFRKRRRKPTVDVMLFPIYIPEEEEKSAPVTKKKRKIRKKLKKLVKDVFG